MRRLSYSDTPRQDLLLVFERDLDSLTLLVEVDVRDIVPVERHCFLAH